MKTALLFIVVLVAASTIEAMQNNNTSPAKPDTIGLVVWHDDQTLDQTDHNFGYQWWYDQYVGDFRWDVYSIDETLDYKHLNQIWNYSAGGYASSTNTIDHTYGYEDYNPVTKQTSWKVTTDPQFKQIGGYHFDPMDLVPYDYQNHDFTTSTGISWRSTPLGCEFCNVQNNYDKDYWDGDPNYQDLEHIEHHTYKRTATTTMALLSGGRAIPGRQILHEISGYAKNIPAANVEANPSYSDYLNGSYTSFHYLPCVSNNLVHLLGGTLHADPNLASGPDLPVSGSLYYVTHAGQDPELFTPVVTGSKFYFWRLYDTPYPLTIRLQTATTNVDLSTNVPEVCVGQNVTFSTSWGGPPPNTASTEWVRWHLPGKFVNEGYNYSASCYTYRKNPDLLDGWTTHCWYQNQPGGACSIGSRLLMSNGQEVNVASSGSFTVYSPSAQFVPGIAGTPAISPSGQTLPPAVIDSGGVLFSAVVTSKYYGFANWTQLVKRYVIGGDPHYYVSMNTWGDFYLDNTLFYNTPDGGTVPVHTQITPGTAITVPFGNDGLNAGLGDDPQIEYYYNWASITDNFKTFLVFRPAGDGIWVTLGRVDWGWSADADWSMLTSATPISPSVTPTDDFPLWSTIYVNGNQ